MRVSVFIPSHITGFFSIFNNKNPLKKGSCGCGFLLDKGVRTTIKPIDSEESIIKINGIINKNNEQIVKEVLKVMKIDQSFEIIQDIQVPISCGFGTSAGSALSLAIALSKNLNLNYSLEKLAQIAHLVEIKLSTGLGDVIAETSKGIVLRTKPGALGYGKIKSLSLDDDIFVGCKSFSNISTSSIIENSEIAKTITNVGYSLNKKLEKDFNLENFLKYSYDFAIKTKLINKEVLKTVDKFNSQKEILGSSMAMLGNTAFAFSFEKNIFEELAIDGLNVYKINNNGLKYD